MELSTRCIQNRLPNFASCKPYRSSLQLKLSLPLTPNTITLNKQGLHYYNYSTKATASEETSGGANQYVKEEPEVVNYSSTEATPPEEELNGVNQNVEEQPDPVNYSSTEATTPGEASNGVSQYVEEQPDAVNYSSIEATTPEEESDGVNQYVKEEPDAVNKSSIEATTPEEESDGLNQYVKEPDAVNYSSVEATIPEEASNGVNQYVKEETGGVVTVNDGQSDESSGLGGFGLFKDDAAADDQFPRDDFLNKLKVELGLEDSLLIALLGVGGITALWLTTSIVGAIDHIPLFPKLMELVGLGYTIWFSTRYLLLKRNRDELVSKIEEIKQQVLGSKN